MFFGEINSLKKKWLVCCSYNPQKDNISNRLQIVSKELGFYLTKENVILVGDFNDKSMNDFCKSYNLSQLATKIPKIVLA